MTFLEAKAISTELNDRVSYFASILKNIVGDQRSPMGLTPDYIKIRLDYKAAKANCDAAFRRLRAFNGHYTKAFKNEILAERGRGIRA